MTRAPEHSAGNQTHFFFDLESSALQRIMSLLRTRYVIDFHRCDETLDAQMTHYMSSNCACLIATDEMEETKRNSSESTMKRVDTVASRQSRIFEIPLNQQFWGDLELEHVTFH